jgi:hypothetical protein
MKFWYSVFVGTLVFGLVYLAFPPKAFAESIAQMPNKGGGKIVLTNEICEMAGKTYKNLNRAYNYTSEGYGSEGCYTVEDETVVIVWNVQGSPQTMRYAASNFTLTKQRSKGTQI